MQQCLCAVVGIQHLRSSEHKYEPGILVWPVLMVAIFDQTCLIPAVTLFIYEINMFDPI